MQQQLIEKQRMENERIVRILKENYDEFVSEIRDNLVRNLTLHRGDENQFDDLTLILLKRIE
ncbi:serine/threonine-protein phosphatase [bacterium]|nr:serine/threonine-protein phosphatase [bacterium]